MVSLKQCFGSAMILCGFGSSFLGEYGSGSRFENECGSGSWIYRYTKKIFFCQSQKLMLNFYANKSHNKHFYTSDA
jgi:hypothetical protein